MRDECPQEAKGKRGEAAKGNDVPEQHVAILSPFTFLPFSSILIHPSALILHPFL